MKKILLFLVAACFVFAGGVFAEVFLFKGVSAQVPNVISVDYETAILSWDAGVVCDANGQPAGCGGSVAMYHIQCKVLAGASLPVLDVPAPATNVTIKSIITQIGKYECFVTASNAIGESGPSNTLQFDAGRRPAPPQNLRIGVMP